MIRAKTITNLTDKKEIGFVLRELFIDAVNAGAIGFSRQVDPGDFNFKLNAAGSNAYPNCQLIVDYTPKTGTPVAGSTAYYGSNIRNQELQSEQTRDLFYYLCNAIRVAADS